MSVLVWKPSYSVGVTELDQQHEILLGLINEFAGENPDRSIKRCYIVLNDLVKYAQLHFNTEETLLGLHGFAGLSTHKMEHDTFTERVFELNQKLQAGDTNIFNEVVDFLKDWYIAHVLGTDREYMDCLKDT